MAWVPIAAMGLSALGSLFSARSQNKAVNQQQRQYEALQQQILGQLQTGPSALDDLLMSRYNQGGPNLGGLEDLLGSLTSGLNTASDPIIQSMRRGPNDSFLSSQLRGLTETGSPFDMSNILSTLEPLRQRRLDNSMADLLAGAPGLGQRFGSAKLRASADLQRQSLEDQAALDAGLVFQGHEAAQARRLQAAGLLSQRDQIQLGRDQGALQALLGNASFGLEGALGLGNLQLAGQSQQDSILQMLLGSQQAGRQQNLQALGILGGVAVPGGAPGYGGAIGDIGQLLLLQSLLGGGKSKKA